MEDHRCLVLFQMLQDLGGQLARLCSSHLEERLFMQAFSLAFFDSLGELVSHSVSCTGCLR